MFWRTLLSGLAVAACASAAQITASEALDMSVSISGSVGSLSVTNVPTNSLTINLSNELGSPSVTISAGPQALHYSMTAVAGQGQAIFGGILDLVSDAVLITASGGGTLNLVIAAQGTASTSISGPTFASQTSTLAIEEFNAATSQWDEIRQIIVTQSLTTAGPDTFMCNDCLTSNTIALSNASAEFRVHTRLEFTIQNDAPEPVSLWLAGTGLIGLGLVKRIRRH